MKSATPKNIDEYLADLPEDVRVVLGKLRHTIRKAAPKAEEKIGYKMPAFYYEGPLVYFAAFKNHCSLFPGNGKLVKELKEELKAFTTATGTIQFTIEKPLPIKLVTKIVKARVKQNEEKASLKKPKPKKQT
ncbi:MAG: DUF1801 domain-containing protein [Bacteroidota bacterium]|nr:DUF1801 domain-containing protein [Bacteroidota bacterium]